MLEFLKVSIRHPRWFLDMVRIGINIYRGRKSVESLDNDLKISAQKHNVNYHQFKE